MPGVSHSRVALVCPYEIEGASKREANRSEREREREQSEERNSSANMANIGGFHGTSN